MLCFIKCQFSKVTSECSHMVVIMVKPRVEGGNVPLPVTSFPSPPCSQQPSGRCLVKIRVSRTETANSVFLGFSSFLLYENRLNSILVPFMCQTISLFFFFFLMQRMWYNQRGGCRVNDRDLFLVCLTKLSTPFSMFTHLFCSEGTGHGVISKWTLREDRRTERAFQRVGESRERQGQGQGLVPLDFKRGTSGLFRNF